MEYAVLIKSNFSPAHNSKRHAMTIFKGKIQGVHIFAFSQNLLQQFTFTPVHPRITSFRPFMAIHTIWWFVLHDEYFVIWFRNTTSWPIRYQQIFLDSFISAPLWYFRDLRGCARRPWTWLSFVIYKSWLICSHFLMRVFWKVGCQFSNPENCWIVQDLGRISPGPNQIPKFALSWPKKVIMAGRGFG